MTGWVPSVVPYMQSARVSIVPMRYGAGTKRKLVQALMARTPTVTTSMGIEGLDVIPDKHVLLANDAESFASATESLLRDKQLWTGLADRGIEQVTALHGPTSAGRSCLTRWKRSLRCRLGAEVPPWSGRPRRQRPRQGAVPMALLGADAAAPERRG